VSERQQQRRARRRRKHSERSSTRRLVAAGGLTAGATLAMAGSAQAAPLTFYVGTSADPGGAASDCTTPTNTDCSLRRAITVANTNADAGDTILFNSSLTGSTINVDSGSGTLPTITAGLTIQGPGPSDLTIDAGGNTRIFDIDPTTPGDAVAILGLRIANGHGAGYGGAIRNNDADLTIAYATITQSYAVFNGGGVSTQTGLLTIDHSSVSGNYASENGGGVASRYGELSVTNSTVSNNDAGLSSGGFGGGIYAYAGDAAVTNSTVSGNSAGDDGGGVYSAQGNGDGASLTVSNTTISGNHAVTDDAGGIYFCCNDTGDALTVISSTITGNTAQTAAGGIQIGYAFLNADLENSIVSGNAATDEPDTDDLRSSDYAGYYFDTDFSLIGVPATYVNPVTPDSNLYGVNPLLGALADNGGPTRTMKPLCGSPVLDQGMAFSLTEDQRGETRPIGLPDYPDSTATGNDGSDIGAVELQSTPGTACASPSGRAFGSRSVDAGPSPTQTVTLTNAGTSTLNVSTVALVGANPGEFTISSDTCAGASVAAGASCTVGVAFDPSSVGAKSALLRFTDDSLVTTQNVLLTGTGLATPPPPVTPANPAPTPAPTHKKKCKKKKHKRTADSAKKKKCKKKKKK
jgi:hypothetical protein